MSKIRVTSRKFYNNFRNGGNFIDNISDFTTNLTGLVLDFCRVEIELDVSWESVASSLNSWNIKFRSTGNYEIINPSGNFITDGWAVGNVFDFFNDYSTTPTLVGRGTITFISDDGTYMFVSFPASIAGTTTDSAIVAVASDSANYNNAVVYTPNLIENNSTYTPNSLLNGNVTAFYSESARSLTPVAMDYFGNNRSTFGEATIQYIGEIGDYIQAYKITHNFYITPHTGELPFLDSTNTLKYVFNVDFRAALSNPNTSKKQTFDGNLGSVGNYGETISQGISDYEFLSLTYSRAALAIEQETDVTIKLKGSFNGNTQYTVYFSIIPNDTPDGEFFDIYKLAYNTNTVGSPTLVSPTDTITSLSSSLSGDELTIIAKIKFNNTIQSQISEENSYMIAVRVGDVTLNNSVSDRTIFLADTNNFISVTDNNGLIDITNINITDYHGVTGISVPFYNEDGFYIDYNMILDLNKQAFLTALSCDLVATNGVDFFSLGRYVYDLQATIVSGVQVINIDTNRGYLQSTQSDYNKVSLTTGANVAGFQEYHGRLGFKINWLEWVQNTAVDTIFYDATKPFNNLNFKTSNYSELNGYEIKLLFRATATGLNSFGVVTTQRYEFYSQKFRVYDYDKDDSIPPQIVATVETFSADGSLNLNGNILTDSDTLFKITWTLPNPVSDVIGSTAVHRIETENQLGTNIYELSSFNPLINVSNNILKPLNGENFVKLSVNLSGEIISECLIDYTKIQRGLNYYLSGKITRI